MGWWNNEPLRIVEIVDCFDFGLITTKEQAKIAEKLGANAQHFHCMNMSAYENDTSGLNEKCMYFETDVAKTKNPDRLKEYLPLAHKNGIRVIVYFNVHWYSTNFGKEHPDWLQIREDGTAIDNVYGTSTSFCINSPYREWVFQMLRDLCKYQIDGIFYDGPIFFANTCYCNSCKEMFRQRYKKDLPKKSDTSHPDWKDLIEFQADTMSEFDAESNRIIKGINPEILLYMNDNSTWPYWPTGRDNRRIVKNTDILGAEGGFLYGDLNKTTIYKPGISAKLLVSQAEGKPSIVFLKPAHGPWSIAYFLAEIETRFLMAETLSGGANCWVAFFTDSLKAKELSVIKEYNSMMKKYPEPFFNTESCAKVALLWHNLGVNFYSGSSVPLTDFTQEIKPQKIGDMFSEFHGLYEGLARSQVPFDVIDEQNLKNLCRYDLLVMPNIATLSEKDAETIKEFVRNGGNLFATFESSLYDEYGKVKNNFQLNELFGVDYDGEIYGPLGWDFIAPVQKEKSALLKDATRALLPSPEFGIKVKPTTAKTLIYFCGKLKGRYEHLPVPSKLPFMTVNKFGKGTVVYIAGTFGINIDEYHIPEYIKILGNSANTLSSKLVEVPDSPSVEVNVRKKNNSVHIHLINHLYGPKRPFTYLHELENVKINVHGIKPKSAHAIHIDKKIRIKKEGRAYSLTLPSLYDYEVIIVTI